MFAARYSLPNHHRLLFLRPVFLLPQPLGLLQTSGEKSSPFVALSLARSVQIQTKPSPAVQMSTTQSLFFGIINAADTSGMPGLTLHIAYYHLSSRADAIAPSL